MLREYQPGQRVVLDRNPRYWRKAPDGAALPYLDRIVLQIVPEQNAELLRIQAGETDLTSTELRPEDYVPVRRAEEEGRLRLIELGVGPDADAFWFCLKPEVKGKDPRFAFVPRPEFRRAISHAVDREAFAETVFLGAAVPVWGPITPGNTRWFWPDIPRYPHNDDTAKMLLRELGLEDRNGNGVVEDAKGTEARFTVITQRGIGWYERGTAVRARRAGARRDRAGDRAARAGRADPAAAGVRLRRDVLPAAVHRSRSGRQPGLLAQLRPEPLLEHVAEDAGHRLGAAHRHADARAGGGARSGAARACSSGAVQQIIAENLPVLLLRGAADVLRAQRAAARRRAVGAAAAGAVERRQFERGAVMTPAQDAELAKAPTPDESLG